jgi:hypothetical protein
MRSQFHVPVTLPLEKSPVPLGYETDFTVSGNSRYDLKI